MDRDRQALLVFILAGVTPVSLPYLSFCLMCELFNCLINSTYILAHGFYIVNSSTRQTCV